MLSHLSNLTLTNAAGRVMSYSELSAFTGPDHELDGLIAWKAGSIGVLRHYKLHTITEGAHMQRQFTIELRVDFADADKLPSLKEVLQRLARNAYTTAQLLSDNPKTTQVAIFSDDFFSGHEEIALLDDTMAEGMEAIGEDEVVGEELSGPDELSRELVEAMSGR